MRRSYPVIGAQVQTGGGGGGGARIDEVVAGQPADDRPGSSGDVVIAVEGEPVTDGIALIVAIRTHQPGETVEFTVTRGGNSEKTVSSHPGCRGRLSSAADLRSRSGSCRLRLDVGVLVDERPRLGVHLLRCTPRAAGLDPPLTRVRRS